MIRGLGAAFFLGAGMGAAWCGHAPTLSRGELDTALEVLAKVKTLRHFCAPCGDTAARVEPLKAARGALANPPADEWTLFLNEKPVDAAYVYVRTGKTWSNLAHLAGVRFPDIPPALPAAADMGSPAGLDTLAAVFSWEGLYRFQDVRKAKAQKPSAVAYRLRIYGRDSLRAILTVDGIGIAQRMALDVEGTGDTLRLALQEYLKENYGQPFPEGQRLFTLIRQAGGVLSTRWEGLRPESSRAAGFKRTALDPGRIEE